MVYVVTSIRLPSYDVGKPNLLLRRSERHEGLLYPVAEFFEEFIEKGA